MSDNKNIDNPHERDKPDPSDRNITVSASEICSVAGSVKTSKTHPRMSSSSERQIKYERAQKCLENAALVSKRIKEHRKATAELLGRPFEEDDGGDTASEMASTMSERTGYSIQTDTSAAMSVQDALNIPGISESLANTLKQKELLMERIKQFKEISKRPTKSTTARKDSITDTKVDTKKSQSNLDVPQLMSAIKEKENTLSVLQVKMKAMETTILDLQEKINEKDQIIEAKNKATTLMSDSLSKKEKDSLIILEDTRQQMIKMQENFVDMETEWKKEKYKLLKQIEEKDDKIRNLEEANTVLDKSRCEVTMERSKLAKKLELKNEEILKLQEKINKLSEENIKAESQELTQKEKNDVEEEKGSIEINTMLELTKKIELLEQLNCQIRQTNKELENKLACSNPEPKPIASSSPSKKAASPLPTRKGGRNTASKMKSPWSQLSTESLPQEVEKKTNKSEVTKLESLIQSLNKDILDKEYMIAQKDSLISELKSAIEQNEAIINDLKLQVQPKSEKVEAGVVTDPIHIEPIERKVVKGSETAVKPICEFTEVEITEIVDKLKTAEEQIASLNEEIEAANKNMIKVKSNHKLKLKQMQKTIDNLSKVSDANAEIAKLNEELHQLSQKVAELEEEKGNLQLHLVDYDSGRLTESEVYKKMVEMENLAEARLKAISVLEAQKFDLVQELHELQQKNVEMEDKLADMSQLQTEQVSSEIKSVQLEEQIDQLIASKKELELVIENLKLDKEHQDGNIKALEVEKEELLQKLENYIQENMELTDKLEKLSAEKVSSAESIEIVESLTTQEKLELEEYNKRIVESKPEDSHPVGFKLPPLHEGGENIEKLVEESAELNRKIELFTQERQEVMDKMSRINSENESLQDRIVQLGEQCDTLQINIEILNSEKNEITVLNEELNRQIEELKLERIEIMKESIELAKPTSVDDIVEGSIAESQNDDKTTCDKGTNRTKSVKQLTKEILKLKNIIKEREDEIGDCQMKILALEEQNQKQNEFNQIHSSNESKLKLLMDENRHLKQEFDNLRRDIESEQQAAKLQAQEYLQQDMQKLHQDYANTINMRDNRIRELENLLVEYENQILNYGNTLQQKDKELSEYINQITKLNDVSQKLKSTIELLEEEKAKDQNVELVKSLNKQITAYQKKMVECEEKIRILGEEKDQLIALKGALENKNGNIETELNKLQEALNEKQHLIKELQLQQQKHSEEITNLTTQLKERDEEVHEVKLELRKESIENEKLRLATAEHEGRIEFLTRELEEQKEKLCKNLTHNEQYQTLETKNKELMEKLKKFAITVKKKSTMYSELEQHMAEVQKQLENKTEQVEQLLIQVETLPALQDKLKHADEELSRVQSQKISLEQQKMEDIQNLQAEISSLEYKLSQSLAEISHLSDSQCVIQKELHMAYDENTNLKTQVETLNNKLADYEVEQKNSTNFVTKITSLEADMNQKQIQITDLLTKLENQEQQLSQLQFGHDAKIQERDLYIESLEIEINKYKNRIYRLEESISMMEDRRHSLERKADQLGCQLQEKQKAYSEYTSQEDELVKRLAVLIDHDRVVEKQIHEIENENRELQLKVQHFVDENQRLRKSLSDIQDHCNTLEEKASRTEMAESEIAKYQTQLRELESHLKRVTNEHQILFTQKKHDIEELESEFHTQIENSIKEKKVLSEKYEKLADHVSQIETKLQEYRNNIENLNINNEELNRINQELMDRTSKTQSEIPDYTEQYINEINNLNAVLNGKNIEISDLNNKIQILQTSSLPVIANLESKIADLNGQLQNSVTEINRLLHETYTLKQSNEQMQILLLQKDEQIQQLMEKTTVTFEMNIPKTEGMIISSTIEALGAPHNQDELMALESQIVSEAEISDQKEHSKVKTVAKRHAEDKDMADASSGQISEEVIVPRKTYLCYKGEEQVPEQPEDPFNSEEGWGLGDCEEIDLTPGVSHLNSQLQQLKKENDTLKAALETSNAKLIKALKKLKELKTNNDVLSNELKISKQLSQSTFLDSAIEDEMKINIQELEKRIQDLSADLHKEKRDKESLRKQNEVFQNAHDRLTEMKEKLDNEIALWKYKFQNANDKISTLQWGGESKESLDHKIVSTISGENNDALKGELDKLENENDELQSVIDQLTVQNKELSSQQEILKIEISDLNRKLEDNQRTSFTCESLMNQIQQMQSQNADIMKENDSLKIKILEVERQYVDMVQKLDQVNKENEEIGNAFEKERNDLVEKISKFEEETELLRRSESDARNQLVSVMSELEKATSKLLLQEQQQNDSKLEAADDMSLTEKYIALQDYSSQLELKLKDAKDKGFQLIKELNSKIQDLNLEKDNLEDYYRLINYELDSKVESLSIENENLSSIISELKMRSIDNDSPKDSTNEWQQRVDELSTKVQQLNTENDQLLSTVAELRSSVSSAVDQRGFEIAELWKAHLAQRESDFQKIEQDLRTQLHGMETKYEQLLDSVQSSTQEETNKLVIMEQMSSLQNKLADKEEHLRNLQDKYGEVISQLDMLRSEMEDEKMLHENKLLGQQEEYEKQIQVLSLKNKQLVEIYDQGNRNMQNELEIAKDHNNELKLKMNELQDVIQESEARLVDLSSQLRLKDNEVHQKAHEYSVTLMQRNEEFENVRKQLLEYEKKVEDLTYEKESELAVLRLKMHEKTELYDKLHKQLETDKEVLTEALNAKIIECTNLNKQISDLKKSLEEYTTKALETQAALENQELEIVTLKDEIFELREALRASSSKIAKHVHFASDTKPGNDESTSEGALNRELLDAVPRAELDLALYMLHQRDVRCEELTMELTQLLEERDTLQLRLSDSLRTFEELKSRCHSAGLDITFSSSQETIPELPSVSLEKDQFADVHRGQTSRSSSISDPDGDKPKLQAKLSELRTVRHSRDVTFRQESEQRQLDLRLLQQDVANLPPEAVQQLTQAHHTLSRDAQSTSTVLLNWLRGKSTPKVVHM